MNWNESKLLIVYPSRSRPERFKEGLLSITNNLSRKDLCTIVVSLDSDDARLEEYKTAIGEASNGVSVMLFVGESKSKIHACNRDINKYSEGWDIVNLHSDDMIIVEKGFDDIHRKNFATHFPNGDGFLHYNDGYQRENVCTWTVMDRKYFERDKHIYNPNYVGLWCDVEATEKAHIRNRHKYIGDHTIICRHIHPKTGQPNPNTGQPAQMDKQYERDENMKRWGEDAIVLKVHRENFYYIPESERVNGFKYPLTEELIEREKQYRQVYGHEFQYTKPMATEGELEIIIEGKPQTTDESLAKLMENTEKTMKLRDKLNKKVTECKSLQEEINALGIVKVVVSVTEEALK